MRFADENGTESGGVDSQISVTASVDSSGYKMFHGWTPLSFWAVFSGCCSCRLLVAVALGLGLVAFGSVSVAPGFVPFSFGGVQLKEEKGTDPRTGSDPKITLRQAFPSMFWDFGSLAGETTYTLRQPSPSGPADRSRSS